MKPVNRELGTWSSSKPNQEHPNENNEQRMGDVE